MQRKTDPELRHYDDIDKWYRAQKALLKRAAPGQAAQVVDENYRYLHDLFQTGLTLPLLVNAGWERLYPKTGDTTNKKDRTWTSGAEALNANLSKVREQLESNPWAFVGRARAWTIEKVDRMVGKLSERHPLYHSILEDGRWDALIRMELRNNYEQGRAVVSGFDLINRLVLTTAKSYAGLHPQMAAKDRLNAVLGSLAHYQDHQKAFVKIDDDRFAGENPIVSRTVNNKTRALKRLLIKLGQEDPAPLDQSLYQQVIQSAGVTYSPEQEAAIKGLVTNRISLLTGYAGTGKTTVLKAVVDYLQHQRGWAPGQIMGLTIAAKAAVNLRQATGLSEQQAVTIAKVQYNADDETFRQTRAILVDEVSMVSESDLEWLVSAANANDCQLILVGDRAQLPSIQSVGSLTDEAFLDQTIPHFELTQVFRQGSGQLLEQVTAIRNGLPFYLGPSTNDETLQARQLQPWGRGSDDCPDFIHLYKQTIADDQIKDGIIPVITATNNEVFKINEAIQYFRYQNGPDFIRLGHPTEGVRYYVGDRVMFVRNQYRVRNLRATPGDADEVVPVVNGCPGIVEAISDNPQDPWMKVRVDLLDGRKALVQVTRKGSTASHNRRGTYERVVQSLADNDVNLSYAVTIHKAQGSTLERVIFYMPRYPQREMLQRELIYSAMTRAQKRLYVWSEQPLDQDHLQQWVQDSAYDGRNSFLAHAPVD